MSMPEGLDLATFDRYAGLSLPRHVAYPMPTWWRTLEPREADELRKLTLVPRRPRDLSLYLHIPFCEKLCLFCACNRSIVAKGGEGGARMVEQYVEALISELHRRAGEFGEASGTGRVLRQIHWGGGTPTYLDRGQIERIATTVAELYPIAEDAEIAIEIDPRVTSDEQLRLLGELGFNRVSLGVQDFDPKVQEHVRRVQPLEMVRRMVDRVRELGVGSVNFDLIYGLPYQTEEGVSHMVDQTIGLRPDRIAFYHYAQIPDRIAHQRGINHEALPDSRRKLAMFLDATERFEDAGYRFIGLDHFALPDEMLSRALETGNINRSFQGMTTGAELDLVGVGCSAISVFPRTAYIQNQHDQKAYASMVLSGEEPATRGLRLSEDDAIRQAVLMELYCHNAIRPERLQSSCGVDYAAYFAGARRDLERLADDGLIRLDDDGGLTVEHPLGRVLMRNIAAVFDGYLQPEAAWKGQPQTFSASA
ncbi:MAG: oxygen-independent coproporphyrinogen III oxidase [Phycisphaeraceae bacterium]|nr:oxygen-independent coproporphyrinogen III oxidase [Phycisphaeraceae bacterium]